MTKVRVFVHHSSFDRAWREHQSIGANDGTASQQIAWDRLEDAFMPEVSQLTRTAPEAVDCRGTTVYISQKPHVHEKWKKDRFREQGLSLRASVDDQKQRWALEGIDRVSGFSVRSIEERPSPFRCNKCLDGKYTDWGDKGLDTKIACDLLSMGFQQFFDVGVLVSDDDELVPAIDAVQDILNRRIIHAGFQGQGAGLRAACWGHIKLDQLVPMLARTASSPFDLATAGEG